MEEAGTIFILLPIQEISEIDENLFRLTNRN